jgi:hypothetical protein
MKKFVKTDISDDYIKYINNYTNFKNKGIIYKLEWIPYSKQGIENPFNDYSKNVGLKK